MTWFLLLLGLGFVSAGVIISLKNDNDDSFKNILGNNVKNITNSDMEIGKLRMEFAETVLEIQKELIEIREFVNMDISSKVEGNNVKVNEIKKLRDKGMSDEEICSEMGIGKGELLLIKDLYLK